MLPTRCKSSSVSAIFSRASLSSNTNCCFSVSAPVKLAASRSFSAATMVNSEVSRLFSVSTPITTSRRILATTSRGTLTSISAGLSPASAAVASPAWAAQSNTQPTCSKPIPGQKHLERRPPHLLQDLCRAISCRDRQPLGRRQHSDGRLELGPLKLLQELG